jgi:hypothetical protein
VLYCWPGTGLETEQSVKVVRHRVFLALFSTTTTHQEWSRDEVPRLKDLAGRLSSLSSVGRSASNKDQQAVTTHILDKPVRLRWYAQRQEAKRAGECGGNKESPTGITGSTRLRQPEVLK